MRAADALVEEVEDKYVHEDETEVENEEVEEHEEEAEYIGT